MLNFPAKLNHDNAPMIRDHGIAYLKSLSKFADRQEVDASPLKEFDSSVLAVLLAWLRIYPNMIVLNPPPKLAVLVSVYGMSDLISFNKS